MNRVIKSICFFIPLLLCLSCQEGKTSIEPKLDFAVQDKYILHLEPIFTPLSPEEAKENWGYEYQIGLAFAKRLDLYQAITSFKRADILLPEGHFKRKAELQYQIINCYYLGKKYHEVIDAFENSILANTDRNFLAFHDLLIILFESYHKCDEKDRAKRMLHTLKKFYPYDAKKLELTYAITSADLVDIEALANTEATLKEKEMLLTKIKEKESSSEDLELCFVNSVNEISQILANQKELENLEAYEECQDSAKELIDKYNRYKKNPKVAGFLNALLPGAGYLYIGQTQSAFTAFCLNSLTTAAAAYFFYEGNLPAGIITSSFEMGWYLGGILGAKEGALFYNERLYETHAHHRMRDHKLFPILMLSHGF